MTGGNTIGGRSALASESVGIFGDRRQETGVLECWSVGVLECWSAGVLECGEEWGLKLKVPKMGNRVNSATPELLTSDSWL